MSDKLIECVPNFSDGRNQDVIKQITDEIEKIDGIKLLDVDPGYDMNRTVVTFVGKPEQVKEAAFQAIKKASELKRQQEQEALKATELKKQKELEAQQAAETKKQQELETKKATEIKKQKELKEMKAIEHKKQQELEARKATELKKQKAIEKTLETEKSKEVQAEPESANMVFPNPTKGVFYINLPANTKSVMIRDASGSFVFHDFKVYTKPTKLEINLGGNTGTFRIEIKTKDGKTINKEVTKN